MIYLIIFGVLLLLIIGLAIANHIVKKRLVNKQEKGEEE